MAVTNPQSRTSTSAYAFDRAFAQQLEILVCSIALISVVLRVWLSLVTHFTQEDALITLRYADNIAAGHGFVYNPGQRVLGTTTPLYTLLLAMAERLGLAPLLFGKSINVLADSALCVVVYRLLAKVGYSYAGVICAFFIAINPIEMRVAISGQESCLVALVCATVWLCYVNRNNVAAYFLSAVLFLLRWDGILLVSVLTIALSLKERRVPWLGLLVFGAVISPWLLFATVYFGSPIPVTLAAKSIVYGWYFQHSTFPTLPSLGIRLYGNFGYVAVALAAFAGVRSAVRSKKSDLLPVGAWFAVYWLSFIVSKLVLFEWYFVPSLFVYLMFVSVGIEALALRVRPFINLRLLTVAVGFVLLVISVVEFRKTLDYTRSRQRYEDEVREPIGVWLKLNAKPSDTVMLEPLGYIGYYSKLRVLDMTGLVTPTVLPFYKHGNPCPWLSIAYADKPEWCVLRPWEAQLATATAKADGDPWEKHYRLVQEVNYVTSTGVSRPAFMIFCRVATSTNPSLTPFERHGYTIWQN